MTLDELRIWLYRHSLAPLYDYLENVVAGGTPDDDSVSTVKIQDDAVTEPKIADANVTLPKLSAAVQTSLGLADTALQPGEIELEGGTPVNAVAASGALTMSGVGLDGDYFDINGVDIYELCADDAQSLSNGNIAVDITSYADKAQGTLTMDTQPTVGDTMLLDDKTYTFVAPANANEDGLISIGTDLATAQAALAAAVNGTDGINDPHESVTIGDFATDAAIITAIVGGTAGNSIVTTETFTAGTNVFDAGTLGTTTAGTDCSAANAVTAIVAAVTASDTQGVGAADGTGDVVDFTADTKGVAGNAITTVENMTNGAFGAATLEGGVDGTVGTQWQTYVDSSYLYVAVDANTITDTNWRRIALGSAY